MTQVVLGVSDEDNVIFARFGITEEQKHGQGWREAFPRVAWDTLSTTSSELLGMPLDEADSGNGDSASLDSIRPDFPQGFQLQESSDVAELENISLCWVDGGCLSQLK